MLSYCLVRINILACAGFILSSCLLSTVTVDNFIHPHNAQYLTQTKLERPEHPGRENLASFKGEETKSRASIQICKGI